MDRYQGDTVCIRSAQGSLRVPAGARSSLRPLLPRGRDESMARANPAADCKRLIAPRTRRSHRLVHGQGADGPETKAKHNLNPNRLGLSGPHSTGPLHEIGSVFLAAASSPAPSGIFGPGAGEPSRQTIVKHRVSAHRPLGCRSAQQDSADRHAFLRWYYCSL